jgi:hypothetical protein
MEFRNNAVVAGAVNFNSTTGGVNYTQTSDYRLKVTFGPADGRFIDDIPIHMGEYKVAPGTRFAMLLAHELQRVAPWCVFGDKDEVDPETGEMRVQQYAPALLVPGIIARIKSRGREVDALRLQMDVMAEEIARLRQIIGER